MPAQESIPGLEPTYRVSELTEEIREVIGEVFPAVWVRGEVQRPRASQRGHLYLELVEKGRGDRVVGKLDGVIWRTDHQRIRGVLGKSGQEITDGQEIRCYGSLDFYGPGGRLQFVVREIDPVFTLGLLEKRRRETLQYLESRGLMETNAALPLAEVPLRVGLVTSKESAAYHDFLTGLAASPYGFRVLFTHAAVQGDAAEREIRSAIELLAAAQRPPDVIVVTRGGGSRTDLAAFDRRAIAEAVARSPVPVVCGLGHETDRSIADLVCHTSVKTPTRAAALLVERVSAAETRLHTAERDLAAAAERLLGEGRRRLEAMQRLPQVARRALAEADRRIDVTSRSIESRAQRALRSAGAEADAVADALPDLVRRSLDDAVERRRRIAELLAAKGRSELERHSAVLHGVERLCHGLSPARILERGYSITRTAGGDLVRTPDQVRSGDRLHTRLDGGEITSTVDNTVDNTVESAEGRG